MRIYLITVIIWFFIFAAMQGKPERGCAKDPVKSGMKTGNIIGCIILAMFWPLVIVGAILMAFIDYWRAK